jgi:hypothetical protein
MDIFLSHHGEDGIKSKLDLTKRLASQQGLKALETLASRKDLHADDGKVWCPSIVDSHASSWYVDFRANITLITFCKLFLLLHLLECVLAFTSLLFLSGLHTRIFRQSSHIPAALLEWWRAPFTGFNRILWWVRWWSLCLFSSYSCIQMLLIYIYLITKSLCFNGSPI